MMKEAMRDDAGTWRAVYGVQASKPKATVTQSDTDIA